MAGSGMAARAMVPRRQSQVRAACTELPDVREGAESDVLDSIAMHDTPRRNSCQRSGRAIIPTSRGSGGTADAHGLGPCAREGLGVRIPPSAYAEGIPMARRTTHRSRSGKKLYAVRDSQGRFKDIQ